MVNRNDKENRVIETVDEEGNVWKMVIYPLGSKTNRFQLSFCFNEKEFLLTKLQSNRSADDLWDLLNKIRKGPSVTQSNFDMFIQSRNLTTEENPENEQQASN